MYFKTLLLSSLAFASIVSATPLEEKPKSKNLGQRTSSSPSIDATFDDQTSLPAVGLQGESSYLGLNYPGFHLTTLANPLLGVNSIITTGVSPHSNYKVVTYTISSKLTLGSPSIVALRGTFDFQSFYLACAVNSEESVLGVAKPCTVSITGTTKAGKTVGPQTFMYTPDVSKGPTGLPLSDMHIQKVGKEFVGLTKVDFETAKATFLATLVDDPVYVLHAEV